MGTSNDSVGPFEALAGFTEDIEKQGLEAA